MGLAIDTVGFTQTGATATLGTFIASAAVAGDSFTVRSFAPSDSALLENIMWQGQSSDGVRVRSPLLHDNVQGIQYFPGETPVRRLLPYGFAQKLNPQDTLVLEQNFQTNAQVDTGALSIYYSNLGGSAARLHMPQDVLPNIKSVKILRVTMPAGGAAGAWLDALFTTSENLLHANTDYAVLGYITSVVLTCIGLRGIDTGNLRICGPGVTDDNVTSQYFAEESIRQGTPHIPIVNSANAGSIFVSALGNVSPSAAIIQLVLAELGVILS